MSHFGGFDGQPVTPGPCDECPWRRNSARGWLGPLSADDWLALAHADAPIACHKTIEVSEQWTDATRQCAGAAIFRGNVCKSPRDPRVAVLHADRDRVFGWNDQFKAHHSGPLADFLADQRDQETT